MRERILRPRSNEIETRRPLRAEISLCSDPTNAASLPANVTAVIMLTEVLFATASALWLGAGVLTPQVTVGGLLILLAALLATLGAASDH